LLERRPMAKGHGTRENRPRGGHFFFLGM